ncbi:hypothetical protein F4553_001844 [Allocatelliglobosispora scoriae]|uniref:Uncharacterized protein n=1 Tax=Allocatelliglobosispora scoriae TaxID=643052 RepID=A0A841BLF4_9ACTN|nr:hypothetical protein [Allocatelliglobosispora scoriae]MBB5868465.1 hypothetical protein [Allocatelliglobosispora scoriae]
MAHPLSSDSDAEFTVTLGLGPFHDALREAIRRRGLPLDRLRDRLARRGIQVALSSLSGWQNGRSVPTGSRSVRAVAALEEILALPQASLSTLLATPPSALDEHRGPLGELLDSVPGSRSRDLDVLSHDQTLMIGASRHSEGLRSRSIVRARRDGVDRYVARSFGEPGQRPDEMSLPRALRNCRLGRFQQHPTHPVMIFELLFTQVLTAGATWVFEWETVAASDAECTDFAYAFRNRVDVCVLEVRFDPAALPAAPHAYTRPGLYGDRTRGGGLALSDYHALHLCVSDQDSGVAGIGWEWPP